MAANGESGAKRTSPCRGSVWVNGAFRVLLDDGTDVTPSSALRQALLAVLVVSPGQARSRKSLQSLFWGDSDSEKAAASLRNTLYLLRRDLAALGPDIRMRRLCPIAFRVARRGSWEI